MMASALGFTGEGAEGAAPALIQVLQDAKLFCSSACDASVGTADVINAAAPAPILTLKVQSGYVRNLVTGEFNSLDG